ncbi:MAG: serine/threonine protein kinase [Myxococcales bacterium]|nr:serine/threonine protein kinase [Myxococcales bacterium]
MAGESEAQGGESTRVDEELTPSAHAIRQGEARQNLVDRLKEQVEASLGARLGRYALLKVLGEGGMGVVFAAYDDQLDRKVAIKLLRTRARGEWHESWLRNEAKAMARLSHPNIVQIYDVGQEAGTLFVAMEFVVGVSLRRWWKKTRRSAREVLEVCMQAGRGLQAAHEAGLVHCDFKPQNILVAKDGRVRVLDFGVAQLRKRTHAPTSEEASEAAPRTSLLGGTPAYMAPELHAQRGPDARSDQFAFCVTLYEGLYGERPFRGDDAAGLRRAILEGKLAPTPDVAVPAWLRRAVLRGLAVDPGQRWPSMAALLAELGRDRGRTLRRWGIGVGAAALVGFAGVNAVERRALQAELEAHRCDAPAAAWDEPRRAAVKAALLGTGVSYAGDTWPRVDARLGEYAAAWSAMRVEACESHRSGAQSDLLYERRVACLEQREADLAALIEVLGAADREVVAKAVRAAFELRPLAACADAEVLLAAVAPAPVEVEDAVARVRATLATVRAELSAGQARAARGRLAAATAAAEATGYRPLLAELRFHEGMAEQALGDYKASAAAFEAAWLAAEASRHEQIAAEAAIRLVMNVGYYLARVEEAGLWERLATAVLERRGGARELESRWLGAQATVRMRAGKFDEAQEKMTAALAAAERTGGPDSYEAVLFRGNLGSIAGTRGDMAAATELSARSLAGLEALLGPGHPDVATLCANSGAAALGRGEFNKAREYLERARQIYERSVGAEHPELARVDNNLGSVLSRMGDYPRALELQRRSLESRRRTLGERHTDTANSEGNLADTYIALGEPAQALAHAERALAGHLASVGDGHPRYGAAMVIRGRARVALGQTRAGVADLEQALAIVQAAGAPREELAEARYQLARALWQNPRQRARAVTLARASLADYMAVGAAYARERADNEAWLKEHVL